MTGGLRHIKKEISLNPTEDLGYICGLIIGDGSLFKTRVRNFGVRLESTDNELIQVFFNGVKRAFPHLNPFIQTRTKHRRFPNGKEYDTPTRTVIVYSQLLYEALRPFKGEDFHWTIPTFLSTINSQIGFLIGIFDSEGSIHLSKGDKLPSVTVYSKHKTNLMQIKELLSNFGITSRMSPNREIWYLELSSVDPLRAERKILFRLPRKRSHYLKLLANATPRRYGNLARAFCESIEFEEVKEI